MKFLRRNAWQLVDLLAVFFLTATLIKPLFRARYLTGWGSIESTFISDGRFLAAHAPHPLWQPLWYCGTRFDYIYPPVLRYGTALLSSFLIPAHAYHVYIAVLFCLGIAGVYFMVRAMGEGRLAAWISAAGCALLSPSFLFIKEVRNDAPYLLPLRLGVLIRYGEGPHISSLSLLPFALGFAWLGISRRRPAMLALAGIFSALVTLTNFYGATALAILYPILVWSLWVAHRERAVLMRALAIPALAYGSSAFWLTPAYFRITLYNLRYVSEPGNQYSVAIAILTALAFGAACLKWAGRKPHLAYPVFVSGSLLFLGLNVLGHYYFNFRIIGEPHRLIPELDMAIALACGEAMRRLWQRPGFLPRAAIAVMVLGALWPVHRFLPHAWEMYPKEPDYRQRVEYRMPDWMASHMPDSRTYVAGSIRFWWDAWHDLAEVGGGSDQGLENPNPSAASWEIFLGKDPELTVRWLQSLGADAVVVTDARSQDVYHDFHVPEKFAALPVLYNDGLGDTIYGIPRRYRSLARVVDTRASKAAQPVLPATNLPLLQTYSDLVEQGPPTPTTTHWNGTDSISVHAPVRSGESVLVQVTYDPAWRAWSHGTELPIRQDAMDFMVVDAPPGTEDIDLRFGMPVGNRVGYAVSGLSLLLCLVLGSGRLSGAKSENEARHMAGTAAPSGYPVWLKAIRFLLRWLTARLPPVDAEASAEPFDPERLRAAETALRSMKMADADGDRYLAKHVPRLAKMLALVPPPQTTGRALELGCYMQITPMLQRVNGYREVRGAYFGPAGRIDRRFHDFPDGRFTCYVDHFDVEKDEFPYPDGYFDLVVAGEILEHMTSDPMWMLLESRRVLAEGGYLLVSTPNVGSVTSVAKTLDGRDNPQIFFLYDRPVAGERPDIGHVREYTLHELGEAVRAAGFEIELLCTTFIEEFAEHKKLLRFLALNGFSTENRGEQSWCLARKRASLPVDRFPWFVYSP